MANDSETTAPSTGPVIATRGLYKVFGGEVDGAIDMAADGASRDEIQAATNSLVAVHDVSFEVQRGESFVVMGLSGSGKSTLIRCLARLIEPTRGEIDFAGADMLALHEGEMLELRRHRMSMVFQHFGLFPHRTVLDNVAYGLEVQGVDRDERHERARAQLGAVGLDGWETHFPQQLSGGMQQRVGLARALAVDPEVLFFDEPFSALDPLIRRAMQDELLELQAEHRRTIVFITHDFDEALRLADRIAIMKDGMFEQVGTAAEILTAPATPYVEAFTKDAPKTKILTVADAMSEHEVEHTAEPATPHRVSVDMSTPLDEAIPILLSHGEALSVVDAAGTPTGILRHAEVAELLRPS